MAHFRKMNIIKAVKQNIKELFGGSMEYITPDNNYFAAANGYEGFRSYFDSVFNQKAYNRLYVLKGGPGTGKSSLMKRICSVFAKKDCSCEVIRCSSDPDSLDGLIIKKNGKKIGILDGTAPHETDAKIPGAVDEIVNLGTAWSTEELIKNRENIEKINLRKSHHYRSAYEYLSLAGCFDEHIRKIVKEAYIGDDSNLINDILFDIKHKRQGRNNTVRLISSYGKDGYKQIDIKKSYNKGISISGAYGSEFIFLDNLKRAVEEKKIEHIRFPSPFSDTLTEAIYINDSNTLVSILDAFENTADTSVFLNDKILNINKECLSYYFNCRENLLQRAKNEFSLASKAHFELEAIYSPSMNFNVIDKITDNLIDDIQNYLIN